ncbi:MAG: Hint domain-containing protein [Pseudomonadota bacterium]
MLHWKSARTPEPGVDMSAHAHQASGLLAGTRIATDIGWRPAEGLCVGDRVMTFDNGLQPLRRISRRLCPGPSDGESVAQPLMVLAPGTAGNDGQLTLLPGQGVIHESDVAEARYGDPFALLPAAALRPLGAVRAILTEAPVVAVSLGFDGDELVYAEGQALLYCAGSTFEHPDTLEDALFGAPARYRMLPTEVGLALAADVARQEPDGLSRTGSTP